MIIQQLHYNQSAAHPMKMYLFYLYNSTDLVLSTVVSTSYFNRIPQTAMTTTFVQRTSTLHRRRRRHHLWPCWKTFVNSSALTIAALVVVVTATAAAVTKRQPNHRYSLRIGSGDNTTTTITNNKNATRIYIHRKTSNHHVIYCLRNESLFIKLAN